jgi:propionyl-CoA carboxylase beta chain
LATAEIAVMGAKASEIIFKKEINEAEDHEAKLLERKEYADLFESVYCCATWFC